MSSKIRVALCITELYIGGAERCMTEIAKRLDRNRFLPVVYCLGPEPLPEEDSFLPDLKSAGVEVHFLGGKHLYQFPTVVARLRQLFAQQQPQIVQTFLFHANIVGRIAARGANIPKVVCGIRVAEQAARWHLWLDRLTQKYVDHYVCVSRSVADFSISKGRLPPQKISVIPNGIDPEDFLVQKPANLSDQGVPPQQKLIVFIGRLEPQKGVQWLVENASLWLEKLPDCDLLIVGDGPLRNSLAQTCIKKNIANRVHFAGRRRDIPKILAAAKLLVLPSVWEGMPNVLLEAMAAGLPVVATDVEGVRELLGPEATQQIVPLYDAHRFAAAIIRIMRSSEEATLLGQENRRRVIENFSISRMVTAYEQLWESLLA